LSIVIAADHAGYELKEYLKEQLTETGHRVEDMGTFSNDSTDYPDFAVKAAEAVAQGHHPLGIVICGTGIGVSITANKVPGIRAALCNELYSAQLAREHNNANVLAMGSRIVGAGLALRIAETFVSTSYSGGRHDQRLVKLRGVEKRYGGVKQQEDAGSSC
jgi:ribose 5-phosphate isomerase B